MTIKRLTICLAAGFAAILGACGSSDPAGSAATTARTRLGSEEFGLSDEELNGRIADAEASIASCMTAAGFEYVPVDPVTLREAMDASGSLPGVSDEDFVAQYGFGITTLLTDPTAELGRGEQNTAIYTAMSDAEKLAYDRALIGDSSHVTLARALEDEDFSNTGGCTLTAVERLFAPEELSGTYVNPADVLMQQDPRLVDAIAAWSECMATDGFDSQHPDDLEDELRERFAANVGGADPATHTGADAAALAELQGEERAAATVSTSCEETQIVPVESVIEAEIYGAPQS